MTAQPPESDPVDRREAAAGVRLPARYGEDWYEPFFAEVRPFLRPGARVLDVGSGRKPAIDPKLRPEGLHYVGMDVSRPELLAAPEGSYDEIVVADVVDRRAELEGRFDLIVSWQVFEHVAPLAIALDNLRSYLEPGGRMVALLSGSFSLFGLASRLMPATVATKGMHRLLRREPETVFPAHYDACHYTRLNELLATWARPRVIPRYRGAYYLRFSRLLQEIYIRYENWAYGAQKANLATHYLLVAER